MSDNFDDLRAALGQMTEGEWQSLPDIDGYCWVCDADRNGVADSVEAANAAGIVLLKNRTPALLAQRDALAARVAELEGDNARLLKALDCVCKDSNPDWLEARVYPNDLLDQIHEVAVRAFYNWQAK